MAGPKAPVPCPKCGGDMWDNMDSPKKGPKAPDYACKDKQNCGAGVWLTDTQRNARRATAPAPAAGGGAPRPQGNIILDTMMYRCLQSAYATFDKNVKDGKIASWTVTEALNLATTLFLARTRDRSGILRIEKPAPKPPEPPPPPPPPPSAPVQQGAAGDPGYYDGDHDDDLPF